MNMKRILCRISGCACGDYAPACDRCGAYLYDADFIQEGAMQPLWNFIDRIRAKRMALLRRCDVCGKKMLNAGTETCCSKECYEKWIPF